MKFRVDFVTNSSCADFIIAKKYLTEGQIYLIHNHIDVANSWVVKRGPRDEDEHNDSWRIKEDDKNIIGDTMMDNFDMTWFLLEIGVNEDHIEMHGCYGD